MIISYQYAALSVPSFVGAGSPGFPYRDYLYRLSFLLLPQGTSYLKTERFSQKTVLKTDNY